MQSVNRGTGSETPTSSNTTPTQRKSPHPSEQPSVAQQPQLPRSAQLPPHPQFSPSSAPTTRRLAPRQPSPFAAFNPQDPLNRPSLPHFRPPSPSIAAAAMSLGALAAAATLAAAAVPSSSPRHAAAYSLAHMPQHNFPRLSPQPREDQGALNAQPERSPQHQLMGHPAQGYPGTHNIDPLLQVPPMLKPLPGAHLPHHKASSAKPVAPAPSSAMHPSQMPSPATHPNGRPKQRRYRASPEQLRQLIARFDLNPSPSSAELQELAAKISMPAQSVVLWFKNRRARVPHKKAEKALNAKRRETGEVPAASDDIVKSSNSTQNSKKQNPSGKTEISQPNISRSASFSAEAAAASMAEMAMALASEKEPAVTPVRQPGRNITNQDASHVGRVESFPIRSPSRSPPPLYRPRADNVVPYDSNLVKRLGCNASNKGAEFVQPATTPRRPRTVPPTPRLFSQKEYQPGDKVEVLESKKGICRAWYSATIVGRAGPRDLSLGASAAVACGLFPSGNGPRSEGVAKQTDRGENRMEDEDGNPDGGDSPRTVRSPAASPTPPVAKVQYTVEFEHRFEENDKTKHLQEEVAASDIRPAAPFTVSGSHGEWRPAKGDAVEVLREGVWFVAVTQTFVVRKGYMVSFESGDVEWVRRPRLRPYQIWRGGESWVTKTKPPKAMVRKGVGLSVTHPPGGKRKRGSSGSGGPGAGSDPRETRARSKRTRSMSVDGSGPDGLPEGWRVDYMRGAGFEGARGQVFYTAPDGNRLRSLKEAQRYVKMMGPV